ncbi:hypothetical protein [Tenggerimyces flavus]|uniref:Uncharacterized protein n=1 Tax=Tenggerimyces flavus TaxID=1708749 RepID=A0ABV7YCT9_9ACTN|nr:hypothetical protein [Tenggerimyces flavus]MBM7788837.1 hypothetical protein [Tenggerimyces flavus]
MSTTAAREVETVWCENAAHDLEHFIRDDCEHPHFTDQQTRALMNRGARTAHVAELEDVAARAIAAHQAVADAADRLAELQARLPNASHYDTAVQAQYVREALDRAIAAFRGDA